MFHTSPLSMMILQYGFLGNAMIRESLVSMTYFCRVLYGGSHLPLPSPLEGGQEFNGGIKQTIENWHILPISMHVENFNIEKN